MTKIEPDLAGPPDGGARPVGGPGADSVEHVLELLRAHGGRVTTSRRLLLGCLFEGRAHRTAEELATEVQTSAPDVHLSTIYRNLDELERLGVVVHAHLGHGPATYHLASETHGHLVCETCGTMLEAPEDLFGALARAAERHFGFRIDPRHFAVLGHCADCAPAAPAGRPGGAPRRARH